MAAALSLYLVRILYKILDKSCVFHDALFFKSGNHYIMVGGVGESAEETVVPNFKTLLLH
jgi:hypothetical protein